VFSVRNEALIKSVVFKTFPHEEMPSLKEMANNPKGRLNKIPFLAVDTNVGSTTHWSEKKSVMKDQQYSFGRPSWFFRFNFSSAIFNVPYARVYWVDFIAKDFSRSCFTGDITRQNWEQKPADYYTYNAPFAPLDAVLPSRFLLSFTDDLEIAFLALDQERLGAIAYDKCYTDLGDDTLHFANGKPCTFDGTPEGIVPEKLRKYLRR
jgi:hypothetical protein